MSKRSKARGRKPKPSQSALINLRKAREEMEVADSEFLEKVRHSYRMAQRLPDGSEKNGLLMELNGQIEQWAAKRADMFNKDKEEIILNAGLEEFLSSTPYKSRVPAAQPGEHDEDLAAQTEYEELGKSEIRVEPPDGMHTSRRHSHWEDVVDLQDDMIRFWFSRFGVAYGEAWGGSMIKAASADFTEQNPDWKPGGMQWALNLGLIERAKLQMADPIWISPDVQKVISAAATSWEPEKLLVEDVFPHLYGFAVFPEPFIVIDMYGKRLSFRAISWAPIRNDGAVPYEAGLRAHPSEASGVIISAYTHRDDFDDYPIMERLEQENNLKIPITQLPTMSLCYVTPWSFNSEHGPVDMTGSGLSDFCKILQVTWRLARQTLTSPSSARLPRAQRKRAEKARLHSDVVVVRLRQARHPKKDDAEPKKIEYSHRWVVGAGTGGFWRNQWYPKLKEHRQIWIAPYVKGPENKELIIKPLRAYEFVR